MLLSKLVVAFYICLILQENQCFIFSVISALYHDEVTKAQIDHQLRKKYQPEQQHPEVNLNPMDAQNDIYSRVYDQLILDDTSFPVDAAEIGKFMRRNKKVLKNCIVHIYCMFNVSLLFKTAQMIQVQWHS